jgi:hypothetical protein
MSRGAPAVFRLFCAEMETIRRKSCSDCGAAAGRDAGSPLGGEVQMNPILMAAFGLIAVLLWRAGPGFAAVTGGAALSAAALLLTLY